MYSDEELLIGKRTSAVQFVHTLGEDTARVIDLMDETVDQVVDSLHLRTMWIRRCPNIAKLEMLCEYVEELGLRTQILVVLCHREYL